METINGYGSACGIFVESTSAAGVPTGRILTLADLFDLGYVPLASDWADAAATPTLSSNVALVKVARVWWETFQQVLADLSTVARFDYLRGGWEATDLGDSADGPATVPFPGMEPNDSYREITPAMAASFLIAELVPALSCLADEWAEDMVVGALSATRRGYAWPMGA